MPNICEIHGKVTQQNQFILSREALEFLATMEQFSKSRRKALLLARQTRQEDFDKGILPDFLKETQKIREDIWSVGKIPSDLLARRIEITGPVNRKMIINALNSDANVFMADFEDSNSPTWENCLEGQVNLYHAVQKNLKYQDAVTHKEYHLNEQHAVLIVRPRGWHLEEAHVSLQGQPISASLFDAMLYLFHNAKTLIDNGTGPYFYLPKMESHLEARLWNDVLLKAGELLNLPANCIKVTVLIETITAAFEMDEIIYELRDHIVGLNCGRWDYIFSYIKKFRNHRDYLLPDRQQITMNVHFLKSYVSLLIHTCHKRGIHAMGGMAAQIPIKNDEKANQEAMAKVYDDKKREVLAGHDGTWVAHPGLIPVALEAFEVMKEDNQLRKIKDHIHITQKDLLKTPDGNITEAGVKNNITVALIYLESWLNGNGCVPIHHLMEDAATAEICRAQLWQWLKFGATLDNGIALDKPVLRKWIDEIYQNLSGSYNAKTLISARKLLESLIFSDIFEEFLTTPAYQSLLKQGY